LFYLDKINHDFIRRFGLFNTDFCNIRRSIEQISFILTADSNEFENSLDISHPFKKSETGIWDIVDANLQSSVLLCGRLVWMKLAHSSIKNNFKLGKYTGIFGSVIWFAGTVVIAYSPIPQSK
jgi:hypothetical protein